MDPWGFWNLKLKNWVLATNGTSRRSLADFSAVSSRWDQAVLVSCKPWGNMSSLISILKSSQILYQNWAVPSEHTSLWKLVPCKNPNPLWKNVSYSNHSVAVSRFATTQISLLKNVPSDKVHGMITQQLFQALTIPPAASEWKALVLDWKSFIVGRQNAIVARLLSSPWFENIFSGYQHQLIDITNSSKNYLPVPTTITTIFTTTSKNIASRIVCYSKRRTYPTPQPPS